MSKIITSIANGKLHCMDHAAAVMMNLGAILFENEGEKARIIIELDPDNGTFSIQKETVDQAQAESGKGA